MRFGQYLVVALGIDCRRAGPPQKECSVSVDAAVGAECPEACLATGECLGESYLNIWAEPPQGGHDFVGSVTESEAGVLGLR